MTQSDHLFPDGPVPGGAVPDGPVPDGPRPVTADDVGQAIQLAVTTLREVPPGGLGR